MLRLVSDENVNSDLVRALWRRQPDLDLVRVQGVGLAETDDRQILEWAAAEGRILLTDDHKTMIGLAWDRVTAGLAMPGVLVMRPGQKTSELIEAILLVASCTTEEEWKDRVEFLPLQD